MPLTLYNTLSRRKETFAPLDKKRVRMYVCGPTVYDLAHIGNARPVIVFDLLYRLLRAEYGAGHVTYVRNITDVDDKINAAAKENRKASAISRRAPPWPSTRTWRRSLVFRPMPSRAPPTISSR